MWLFGGRDLFWTFRMLCSLIHSFIHSFCSPAPLERVALTSFMYFSFVIHEMEIIILICLPHKFVKRINWCLDRVLKRYTNIKVTLNRPHGITELSKKKAAGSWTVSMLYSSLGFQAPTVCAALEVGFICSRVPVQRCAPWEAPLL